MITKPAVPEEEASVVVEDTSGNIKNIKFRASGLGTFVECQYKAVLQAKDDDVQDSDALRIGTNVHSVLINKMSHGMIPYPNISKEEHEEIDFIYAPCETPTMDLKRGSFCIPLIDLFGAIGKRIMFVVDTDSHLCIEIPEFDTGENMDLDALVDSLKLKYGDKCPVDFKIREWTETTGKGKNKTTIHKAGLNLMSKTRGSDSEVYSDEVCGIQHRETSIYEIVDKNMFSRPLTSFEQRTESFTEVEVRGIKYKVKLTGQFDAAGPAIIVDLKTSKTMPKPTEPGSFMKYVVQQACYAKLNGIKDVKVVLLYIVKTKVPKLVPVAFNFTINNLDFIDNVLYKYIEAIDTFEEGSVFPSYGMHCRWCHYKQECKNSFPLYPNVLSEMEIAHHSFKI